MTNSGFTKKRIDVTVKLGAGDYGTKLVDTVTLTSHRMLVDVAHGAGESMGECQLRVFGLKQEMMTRLTQIGHLQPAIGEQNSLIVSAGDDVTGLKLVFNGTITTAVADYNSSPDVAFNILAHTGMTALVKPVGASSFLGTADVAEIMSGFASTIGFAFENNGVNVKLSNPYFPGTALTQIRTCARAADIRYSLDRGVLAIWPKDASRKGTKPLISPETGMVGYPAINSNGMTVQSFFNWDIKSGCEVEIAGSIIPQANGIWHVSTFSHSLSSEMPGGPWFTTFQCSQPDAPLK